MLSQAFARNSKSLPGKADLCKKELSFSAYGILRGQVLMPFTRPNAGAGHSASCLKDRRLRHPCRRLDKLEAALGRRHDKEPAAACIMMQLLTAPLAVRPDNLPFPGRVPAEFAVFE